MFSSHLVSVSSGKYKKGNIEYNLIRACNNFDLSLKFKGTKDFNEIQNGCCELQW